MRYMSRDDVRDLDLREWPERSGCAPMREVRARVQSSRPIRTRNVQMFFPEAASSFDRRAPPTRRNRSRSTTPSSRCAARE